MEQKKVINALTRPREQEFEAYTKTRSAAGHVVQLLQRQAA